MNTFKTPKGTELPIMSLKGKDYLEVKYRLVWFREDKPNWAIVTEIVKLEESYAIAKAQVLDQEGHVVATAHKREDKQHFQDFIEKCETGAVGRALALCGYGTQFAPEIEEGDRIVDAPAARLQAPQAINNVTHVNTPVNHPTIQSTHAQPRMATPKQRDFIWAKVKELGLNDHAANEFIFQHTNKTNRNQLTFADIDVLVNAIKTQAAV
jgi:hypothetical protein